jgi:tRNA/tmRNA/rRNA uracil-C5-methylase (TrmA/RlmC/RlmD family)
LQYRNKLEFTFSNRAWRTTLISDDVAPQSCLALGFHIPKRFDKVLDIQQCALQAEPSNAIRNAIRRFAVENGYTFYDQKQQCGLLRNLIIRIGHNSSSMHSRNHAHGAAITKMSDIMAARSDKLQDGYHGDSSTSVMDTPVPPSCDAHDYHHWHRMADISAIAPSTKEEGKYLPNTMDDRQEVMAAIVFSHYDEQMVMAMMRCVHAAFPALTSLQYVINSKANDSIHDCPAAVYAGRDYIVDTIGEYRFRIGLKSFFQTNTAQAQRLYDAAIGMAHLTGRENVYDLYCGAGTIGCCMSRSAAGVVGIDIIPQAIEDARANSLLNDLPNARFVCGDVKDMLGSDFINAYGAADIAVLDPPRAGLHPHVVKCLLEMLPPTLVYVSCNPAAMARDIAALGAAYDLRTVQAVDMFPHTQHVECVAALRLRT